MNVNIGYAWGQWMRAQQTAAEHADPDVRARAQEKAAEWERVIAGMQAGTIAVGSRTPTSAPAWVTLEVVTGGFATGGYTAGGAMRDDERTLAEQLGVPPTRLALNLHYLTHADELLASGRYRIDVPEEGALLVIAWLRRRGELERANAIIEELAPWFETLRFYAMPAEQPLEIKTTARLQDVGTTLTGLDVERRQPRFVTMRKSVLVWKPLRERVLALFEETVGGGSPGVTIPSGWTERAAQLAFELGQAGTPKTHRAREVAAWIALAQRCATNPASVTKAEYHGIERSLAARARLGAAEREARRASDMNAIAAPLHFDLRRVLVERLRALPATGGVDADAVLAVVSPAEAATFGVPPGTELPRYFEPKVARSCDATLESLVERGVIGSGGVFARVLPQVTSQLRAHAIADPNARRLYAALYTAFRRRRGLLLLGYQHQVRFEELPWVAALDAARTTSREANERAREAVANTSGVALRAFPYTILPNKLITELSSLTNAAALKLPLVEELAADIFMGSFTQKFVEAAKVSARLLEGTLYQRYYAIDVAEIARLPASKIASEFASVCARRAGPSVTSRSPVAHNGKIIEQAQILTTHNLAVLFEALPLREQLASQLRSVAETCFAWSVRRLRLRTTDWHQILVNLKNAAYAWRQMVFYLSFTADVPEFLAWSRAQLERANSDFRQRFEPAIRGLELAAGGVVSSEAAFASGGGRVFTGWSTDRHWLAPPK
jgi:hypothetical protein